MREEGQPKPLAATVSAWAARAIERGRAAFPGIEVSEGELARAALLRLAGGEADAAALPAPGGGEGEAGEADLEALDAAELFLAAACARGDAGALVRFRAHYFEPLAPSLRRMGLSDAQHDDLWQKLCERLFVGQGGAPPRIARYAGAGDLRGLTKVVATRVALDWLEQGKRQAAPGDEWLRALPAGGSDPELHAIKGQHRAELKEEFEAAVAGLSPRERMVLRLHLIERLGIDQIAAACGVHRATAARMVARAKESLAERVRGRLAERWRVGDASMPALKTLVDSQVELSLERLLAGA